jgi:hypothetical protein
MKPRPLSDQDIPGTVGLVKSAFLKTVLHAGDSDLGDSIRRSHERKCD